MPNTINARILVSVLLVLMLSAPAFAEPVKHILILNSYHQGFKWTDEQTQGVIASLNSAGVNSKMYIEYMGTKWAFDKQYFDKVHDAYKVKFQAIHFDLIVATDDDALNFLVNYRDDIFGKVPVVFCGVNWFNEERLKGRSLYTGVNEDADIALNIDLLLTLYPKAKNLYMVADLTTTGRIVHQKIHEIMPKYKDRVAIHFLDDLTLSQLQGTVAQLSDDSVVFLTIYQKDRDGAFIEFSDIASVLSKNSRVPVYGLWDFYLGFGIVGGMLTSGHAQGQSAGELAVRILRGESPSDIPVIMKSPNRYMFDYQQLQRYGIKRSDLPAESIVINEPPSFYAINKGFVWVTILGSVLATVVIFTLSIAIHRRNRAEKALRESEGKYHTLVDNLSIGVYRNTGGPDGRFLQANPAMVKIFGYDSLDEFMQINVSDLYQEPGDRINFIDELTRNGFVKTRELPMKKKDGTPIWVLCNANAIFDENRRVKWSDGVNEDITERKHLEMQLRQAQKMEAIGTLAGGVAHDFNNILTAIIGYGNLLKIKIEHDQALRYYLDPILSSAEKAAHLTQSLLAFSRKQVISLRPVSLNEIVEGMGKLLLRVIGEDVDLQIQQCGGNLMVLADRSQIEQVVLNLVTNGRDAMPDGGLLSVETDWMELTRDFLIKHEFIRPGTYAVISVSDTGVGMDEDTQARIFEPFFSTKTVGKGTGLGLSIVYGIIKQHNGDISVYSEKGKGTTFKIYLPLASEKGKGTTFKIYLPLAEEMAQDVERAEICTPPIGGAETILIGEDNDEVRRLARDILTYGGYAVVLAHDGEDAVAKFRDNADRIDLLLLDVVMPKKNGKEVYDEVTRLRPGVKVLFMSGYTANIIHKKGVLEEGLNFIPKPLSPDRLLRKVREVLSRPAAES